MVVSPTQDTYGLGIQNGGALVRTSPSTSMNQEVEEAAAIDSVKRALGTNWDRTTGDLPALEARSEATKDNKIKQTPAFDSRNQTPAFDFAGPEGTLTLSVGGTWFACGSNLHVSICFFVWKI